MIYGGDLGEPNGIIHVAGESQPENGRFGPRFGPTDELRRAV